MVGNRAPAIHFVIHHPKLREALENLVLPIKDTHGVLQFQEKEAEMKRRDISTGLFFRVDWQTDGSGDSGRDAVL